MILYVGLPDLGPDDAFEKLGERLQYELIENLAESARAKWIKIAGQSLMTTRRDYIAGIQEVHMRQGVATIALVGMLPNLIENGMDTVDMHDTLLGPNVKDAPVGQRGKHRKKDGTGYYRAIPFRHGTPVTSGAVGVAMGAQYEGHHAFGGPEGFRPSGGGKSIFSAKDLGHHIYDAAKKLKGTIGMPGQKVKYGGRLPAGLAPKLKEHHATDIFAGMIKSQKKYVKATQSQYATFRTISTGSNGWMRTATPGRNFSTEVQAFVVQQAPRMIASYLKRAISHD